MNTRSRKKWFIPTLIIITVIAFLIRLQVSRELKNADSQVVNPSVYTDMGTYKTYSEKIVQGEYKQEFYYQPFYYAVFLPLIKSTFGFGIWPVIICQVLLSVATIWLSGVVAARLWGRSSGIITAILLTFSSILILYVPYYLIATLQAFWVALIAFLSVYCLDYEIKGRGFLRKSSLNLVILGTVLGLGILTRGNIWFFVPGIIAALVFVRFKYPQKDAKWLIKLFPVFLLVAMMIIPQIPFSVANTKIKGRLCGPSTAAGAVLSLGNTPESPPGGRDAGTGPGPMEYPKTCRYWSANADKVSVFQRMWDWFCREPLAFCELQWRKMLLFWDRREIPNNIAVENQGLKSRTWQITGLIPVGEMQAPGRPIICYIVMNLVPFSLILLVSGLSGVLALVFKTLKRPAKDSQTGLWKAVLCKISAHLKIYLLFYFVIAYWLGTSAFYILARFRTPVLPLLAISAGGFLQALWIDWKGKKRLKGKLVALVMAFLLVCFGYDYYRYVMEVSIISTVRPDGVVSPMGDELLVMDNGPQSFGSWLPLPLEQGVPVIKSFSVPEMSRGDKVSFFVDMIWEVPGKMELELNGKKYQLKESRPIRKSYEFPIDPQATEKITFIPRNMDCKVYVILDHQRDYGRTKVDGKYPHGELVSHLIFTKIE